MSTHAHRDPRELDRVPLDVADEPRGALTSIEFDRLPFEPQRVFLVTGVPVGFTRGCHAHRSATQAITCVAGVLRLTVRGPDTEQVLDLVPGDDAVIIEPGIWTSQTYLAEGTTMLVVSSDRYEPDALVT